MECDSLPRHVARSGFDARGDFFRAFDVPVTVIDATESEPHIQRKSRQRVEKGGVEKGDIQDVTFLTLLRNRRKVYNEKVEGRGELCVKEMCGRSAVVKMTWGLFHLPTNFHQSNFTHDLNPGIFSHV